jgi:hypothetical protein
MSYVLLLLSIKLTTTAELVSPWTNGRFDEDHDSSIQAKERAKHVHNREQISYKQAFEPDVT